MLDNPNTSLNTRNIELKKIKTKLLSAFQKDYEAHPLMMHQVEKVITGRKRDFNGKEDVYVFFHFNNFLQTVWSSYEPAVYRGIKSHLIKELYMKEQ